MIQIKLVKLGLQCLLKFIKALLMSVESIGNSDLALLWFDQLIIQLIILCQVSASLDALMDVAGGKINIHVLMALAGFASVFMGNPLEGGLLLAMFNLAHIGTWARLIWLWFSTSNM